VLLEMEGKMVVNGLIAETLSPKNSIAKLYMAMDGCSVSEMRKFISIYELHMDSCGNYKVRR